MSSDEQSIERSHSGHADSDCVDAAARASLQVAFAPDALGPQGRDAHGRFLPGNLAAVSHALRAVELPPELVHLRDEVAEFMAAALVDEGDPDVPTRRRSLLTYRARLHRRIVQIDDAIELRGLLDRRGKLRVAWLQQLAALINAAKALDQLLGLERRARPTPSLSEYLRQRASGSQVDDRSAVDSQPATVVDRATAALRNAPTDTLREDA